MRFCISDVETPDRADAEDFWNAGGGAAVTLLVTVAVVVGIGGGICSFRFSFCRQMLVVDMLLIK